MNERLRIEPADATLGATVTGVKLSELSDGEWQRIEAAFHERAVLIFPGQHLSDDEQAAFGGRFGELSIEGQPLTNQNPDGSVRPPDDPTVQLLRGNEGWHTDSSFQPISAKASILSARKLPSRGGETGWADMRAAYDALEPAMRERIANLRAYHSLFHSQAKVGQGSESMVNGLARMQADGRGGTGMSPGGTPRYEAEVAQTPPLRPLVKAHPVTGRPALYIGRHAYGIPGMSEQASERLLQELVDFACRPPRVLEHRWSVGDVAIWDNRRVLHRARPWDSSEPREMFHVRVAGDPATEMAS